MTTLATAFVNIRPDTTGFGTRLSTSVNSSSQAAGTSAGRHFSSRFASALKVTGVIAAAFAVTKSVDFLKGSVAEAREAQKVTAQTQAVIKSTGGAAKVTADQVASLAGAISLKTGIDDEAIQSGENLILTFKNIRNEAGRGNDIFNQTTQVVTDMSTAMGTNMKSSAILVGKALNDPIKGLTALTRVGVTFSEQQQNQIKRMVANGHAMQAQKVILRELNSEFGGSAEAQATAGEKAKVAFENLKESVGTQLLPVLDKLEMYFVDKIVPALYKFGGYVQSDVIPTLKVWARYFREEIAPVIKDVSVRIYQNMLPALKDLGQFFLEDVLPAARELVGFIRKHWPEISDVIKHVFAFIKDYIKGSWDVIKGIFRLAIAIIKGDWSGAWDAIKEILKGAWTILKAQVKLGLYALKELLKVGWELIKKGADKAWDGIVKVIKGSWELLKKAVGSPIYFVLDTIINKKLIGGFNKLADWVNAPTIPLVPFGGIPHFAKGGSTGPGAKYDVAGLVHADEHVWTKEEIARFPGGHKGMERLRAYFRGYADGGRVWPLPGSSWSTYPGHDGIDLNTPGDDYGKPFLAAASGTISYTGWNRGYGDAIFERGRYGELVYGHGSKVFVHAGQSVNAGQVIGLVGSTGHSTGPHLHFGFPGGTPEQALAFLRGASFRHAASGVAVPGNPLASLSSAALAAVKDPRGFLMDRIAGPLKSMGGSGLTEIIKGVPLAVVDGLVQKIKAAASKFAPDALQQTGSGLGNAISNGLDNVPLFDTGGVLRPGTQRVRNGTGRPEAVLDPEESAAFKALARAARQFQISGHADRGDVSGLVKELLAQIRATLGKNSPLLAQVNRLGDKMIDAARERDRVVAQLSKATDHLGQIREADRQYRADVRSSFLATPFAQDGAQSVQGMRAYLRDQISQNKAFATAEKKLVDRGLNRKLLAQLVGEGPDALGRAQSLAGLSRKELHQFAELAARQAKQAGRIANIAGDARLGDREADAVSLVHRLRRHKASVTRELEDYAEVAVRAVTRRLAHAERQARQRARTDGHQDRPLVHIEHQHVADGRDMVRKAERKARERMAIAGGS